MLSMSERKDPELLLDILNSCKRIRMYIDDMSYDDFIEDWKTQDAVQKNIELIGEAANKISGAFKEKYPLIP